MQRLLLVSSPLSLLLCSLLLRADGIDPQKFDRIDAAAEAAIKRGACPGAVVLVVHRDEVVYRKAFGSSQVLPEQKAMTVDTVFDLASLTKPIATASAIFWLVEQKKIDLADRASKHWPAFTGNKKETITIEQLLLHTSGLTPDNAIGDYKDGPARAFERITALPLEADPGTRFRYSDVGYIVLGHIAERLSGETLDVLVRKRFFKPLKMADTSYMPLEKVKDRSAPTENREGKWLKGEVHDPRAAALGGVAGHAGLFGTADDLGRFARMLLHGGELDGTRVLKADTVKLMTESHKIPGGSRSLGWDVDTAYSGQRGDLFPKGEGFGHTGFTGTSIWIDPKSQTVVILLTHSVHPNGKGDVRALRREIGTLAAPQ